MLAEASLVFGLYSVIVKRAFCSRLPSPSSLTLPSLTFTIPKTRLRIAARSLSLLHSRLHHNIGNGA